MRFYDAQGMYRVECRQVGISSWSLMTSSLLPANAPRLHLLERARVRWPDYEFRVRPSDLAPPPSRTVVSV